ncbi:unnamed protein product [Vitrella brassicaformis CCMP3155]|uniref:4'-phosphopantetheinyl transferase domain-containing protein n=1 Tax=Vitrella brassicaformis (strain CCMP3155) TaxID=1169540 RepID=A0A0G4EXT6_VITBC|nr:unnamed protein product [Vitrella brassicaformis CCMP3155]|eukprot:CEM03215.1 unnamed protein product [Vitrella brassicaformis CCMP3155]
MGEGDLHRRRFWRCNVAKKVAGGVVLLSSFIRPANGLSLSFIFRPLQDGWRRRSPTSHHVSPGVPRLRRAPARLRSRIVAMEARGKGIDLLESIALSDDAEEAPNHSVHRIADRGAVHEAPMESHMGDEEVEESEPIDLAAAGEGEITLTNSQREIALDMGLLERQIKHIRDIIGVSAFDIGVELVDNQRMQHLNRDFRAKDRPTDILSFRCFDDIEPGSLPKVTSAEDLDLGDIFISAEYVQERCDEDRAEMEAQLEDNGEFVSTERGVSGAMAKTFTVRERLPLLVIHGILHLLGYDDQSDSDWSMMVNREEQVIKQYSETPMGPKSSKAGTYVVGVGTDIVFIPRVKRALSRAEERFTRRIFTAREHYIYRQFRKTRKDRRNLTDDEWLELAASFVAKRFATKEAVSKALGVGLRIIHPNGLRLKDIEVLNRPSGQPYVELLNEGRRKGMAMGVVDVAVSQADEKEYAVAFATATGST